MQEKKKKQPDDAGRGSFDGQRLKVWEGARRTSQACRLQLFAGWTEHGRVHRNSPVPGARRHEGAGEAQKKRAPPIPALGTAIRRVWDWGWMEWRRES